MCAGARVRGVRARGDGMEDNGQVTRETGLPAAANHARGPHSRNQSSEALLRNLPSDLPG